MGVAASAAVTDNAVMPWATSVSEKMIWDPGDNVMTVSVLAPFGVHAMVRFAPDADPRFRKYKNWTGEPGRVNEVGLVPINCDWVNPEFVPT